MALSTAGDGGNGIGGTPTDGQKAAVECKLTLEEVLPRLVEAAQEQDGSRFLQTKLCDANDQERNQIFEAALPATVQLAGDVFGNFVVQKLLERGTDDQKKGTG